MKLSLLGLITIFLLALTSCQKTEQLTDDQIIDAIQNSNNKQSIDPSDLPSPAQSTLDNDYSESYTEETSLVDGLGYEVGMRRGEGSMIGEHNRAYFDINGRELMSGEMKRHRHKHRFGHDRKECFDFVLPITFIMPDESLINIEEEEDFALIKAWYQENPGTYVRPQLVYPVDIEFKDGVILTVNNSEEMQTVFEDCKGQQNHEPCFDFVYPVSFEMPDGTILTGDSKEEIRIAIKSWYQENPGVHDRPQLQFPVDLIYEDGTLLTVNSREEIHNAIEECE